MVGVTGGIGSGKSSVAAALADHGWPVVDADAVAREVVAPGEPALTALADRFGADVLAEDGTLDRAELARRAFATERDRADLDAITHPHIASRVARRLAALTAAGEPVAVLDHPLLLETGQADRVDAVVVVLADVETRVRRLVEQRGLDEVDVRARLAAQTDDATRRAAATHVIDNDGTRDELAARVGDVVADIERTAARARVAQDGS